MRTVVENPGRDGGWHLIPSEGGEAGLSTQATALAQAPFRSLSDTLCVQTICYVPDFSDFLCLLLSILPCAISPEALFSLLVCLGQQTVIHGSSSKEAQSSKSPSLGVMLEADPPAKHSKCPLKHRTVYSYNRVTPLMHKVKHV